MPKGIYAAASVMYTDSRALDVLAENIANLRTSGFRRAEPLRDSFAERLARAGQAKGDFTTDGGMGVHGDGVYRVHDEGAKEHTGNPLDLAIAGEGFFVVEDDDGNEVLTRAGNFTIDDQGRVRDSNGWTLQGANGAVQIPDNATEVIVDEDAMVVVQTRTPEGGFVQQELGALRLVAVDEPGRLHTRTGRHFQAPEGMDLRPPEAATRVLQGYVEEANIEPVTEMVKMIEIQRRYDAAQNAMRIQQKAGEGFSDILRGSG